MKQASLILIVAAIALWGAATVPVGRARVPVSEPVPARVEAHLPEVQTVVVPPRRQGPSARWRGESSALPPHSREVARGRSGRPDGQWENGTAAEPRSALPFADVRAPVSWSSAPPEAVDELRGEVDARRDEVEDAIARWEAEGEDLAWTREIETLAAAMLEDIGLGRDLATVSCGQSICRASLEVFDLTSAVELKSHAALAGRHWTDVRNQDGRMVVDVYLGREAGPAAEL